MQRKEAFGFDALLHFHPPSSQLYSQPRTHCKQTEWDTLLLT